MCRCCSKEGCGIVTRVARLLDKKSKFRSVSFKLETQETMRVLKAEALCLKACESEQITLFAPV